MRTLMSEGAWVHYGQIYVQSGGEFGELAECFGGQRNGLCGAAVPGTLFLITGLHTGKVGFTVELHDERPGLDDEWEEIVEASFRPIDDAALVSWGGEASWPLDLDPTDYRVRYCATRMDAGHATDTRMDDEPEVDRYLLQFWPGAPEPDRVIKQTSENAAYWHDFARKQPPPPTPEEKAEAQRRERERQRRETELAEREYEARQWGGRLPGDRLRQLRSHALSVARLDRPLVDMLADTDPGTQRKIARWTTRRAFAEAGLTDVDWIAPALAAMDRSEPLPSPFDEDRRAWDRLLSDPLVPRTLVPSPDRRHDNCRQQAMAFPAIFSARQPDPLAAALDALWAAAVAFGPDRRHLLFAEVRSAFPVLGDRDPV